MAQSQLGFGKGITDAAGHVTLEVSAPLTARMVAVLPSVASHPEIATMKFPEWKELHDRVIGPFAFKRWYRVPLSLDVNGYQLAIEVPPARAATLRVVDSAGKPLRALALCRDITRGSISISADDGVLKLRGLPRAKASVLYLLIDPDLIRRIEIPAGEEDVDLGTIVSVPEPQGDSEVRITSVPVEVRFWRPEEGSSGVTIVSLDGQSVLTMSFNGTVEHAVGNHGSRALPKIPAGTYYVAGGLFMGHAAQVALIERARAGEDLRALGVPTITAAPGSVAELEVDPWKVEKILLGGEENTDRP